MQAEQEPAGKGALPIAIYQTCTSKDVVLLTQAVFHSEENDGVALNDKYDGVSVNDTTITIVNDDADPFAFAVYSKDDNSLTFYMANKGKPSDGDQYKDKEAINVYDVDLSASYSAYTNVPWYSLRASITTVVFDSLFKDAQPNYTRFWFYGFNNCESFKNLDYLDTSKVTDMYNMFRGCRSLTELDVSGFETDKVTNMGYMFYNCNSLTELDVSEFKTDKVTDMGYMFYQCSSLTSIDVSKFDTSECTTMAYMFAGCSSITELDLSSFDTSNVTSYSNFATSCDALSKITIDDTFDLFEKSTSKLVSQQNWLMAK